MLILLSCSLEPCCASAHNLSKRVDRRSRPLARSRLGAPLPALCPSAAQVRFSRADAGFFNCVGERGTDLPPPPSLSQARHSRLTSRTTLEAFRKAVRRRSS